LIFSEIFEILKKNEKFLKFVKIREKQRKNIENISKTDSLHSFLNSWQQKISGLTIFSEIFQKFDSDVFQKIFRFFQKFLKKTTEQKNEDFLKKI